MIRVQNVVAALAFFSLLVAEASMQLLHMFPGSAALWQLNVGFARELRPVLEGADLIMGANPYLTLACLCGFLFLCWIAVRTRHLMATAATTHAALFAAIYASIASFGANLGPQVSSAAGFSGLVDITWRLAPFDQALVAAVMALFLMCLLNHFDILRDLARTVRHRWSPSF